MTDNRARRNGGSGETSPTATTWRTRSTLALISAVYVVLVASVTHQLGANYEEVVPYVLTPLEVRDSAPADTGDGSEPPRFVTSAYLPRLAFEPTTGVRLPLLNQPYMTDHLSYGGVALAALGIDPLWAARLWHAAFGLLLLWLVHAVALLLGFGPRGALIAAAFAATSLQVTFMYAWARFDESLPSLGSVAVLWAALRFAGDGGQRWVWVGMLAAAIAISGKVTALWIFAGLALAGGLARWRPPSSRALAAPLLASSVLFAPLIGFAVAEQGTSIEVRRRLAFLADLFTSHAIPSTAANLIRYLGDWGGILAEAIHGGNARGTNVIGQLLVCATLVWLAVRSLRPGPVPRRYRLEAQMLAVVAVVFVLVALFYREHHDYQFVLLVPFNALALAAFLEWGARLLDRRLPAWAAGAVVCAIPLAMNLSEQCGLYEDLARARNAMFDLGVQRASAAWLSERHVYRPIVVTFYAVGTYELFTDSTVRPLYAYPLLRRSNGGRVAPDLVAAWRILLADGDQEPRLAVLPAGENPIEARHFDEAGIRNALLEVAAAERVAVFANRDGEELLEVWRVTRRPELTTAPAPSTAGWHRTHTESAARCAARRAVRSSQRGSVDTLGGRV
jgi:hypothetical protein